MKLAERENKFHSRNCHPAQRIRLSIKKKAEQRRRGPRHARVPLRWQMSEPQLSSTAEKDCYENHDFSPSESSALRQPQPVTSSVDHPIPKSEGDASSSEKEKPDASNIAPTTEIEKNIAPKLTPLNRTSRKMPWTTASPAGRRPAFTTPASPSSPSACNNMASSSAFLASRTEGSNAPSSSVYPACRTGDSNMASCSAHPASRTDGSHTASSSAYPASRTEGNEEPFAYAISLGQFCMTANSLRDNDCRKFSTPFDWCYTNIAMVQWCMQDDFAAYLNSKLYFQISNNTVKNDPQRCGHEVFSRFLNRKVVFNHHNPLYPERDDMEYFVRCAQRFRLVLANPRRKLFAMTMRGEFSKCKEGGSADILFTHLQKVTNNFLLLFIYVVEDCERVHGKKKMVGRCNGDASMEIYEVRCEGGHSGLRFREARDAKRYKNVLLNGRSFELVDDPLKAKAKEAPNIRAGKYGDLDELGYAPKKADDTKEVCEKRKTHDIEDLDPRLRKMCKIKVEGALSTSHIAAASEEPSREEGVLVDTTHVSATAASEEPSQKSVPTDTISAHAAQTPEKLSQTSTSTSTSSLSATPEQKKASQTARQNSTVDLLVQVEKDVDMDIDSQPVILHVKPRDVVTVPTDVVIEIDTDDDVVQIDLTNVEDEDKRIIAEQANWNDADVAEAHDSQQNKALDSFLKRFSQGGEMDVTAVEALLLTQDNDKQQLVDDYNIAKALHDIEEEGSSSDDEPMRAAVSSAGSVEREKRDRASFQMNVERLVSMGFPHGKATATLLRCGSKFENALEELLE